MRNYNKQLSLQKLVLAYLTESLLGFLNPEREVPFPQKIGSYTFKRKFLTSSTTNKPWIFTFALYENAHKEKAIAKMWNGKIKNFACYTLRNEIIMYQVLNEVRKRLDTSLPKKFRGVSIPKFLGTFESKHSLGLLVEFINGELADTLPEEKSFKAYLKVSDFLRFLGTKLTFAEKARITHRKPISLALLYPLLLAKAICTHPKAFSSFLRGVPIFLLALTKLFRKSRISLRHGDLSLGNILISPKKITLIDLQLCVFSELDDLLTSLCICWDNGRLRNLFLTEIRKRYGHEKDYDVFVRGLMANIATHALTGNSYSRREIDKFIDYINFAVNGKLTL